MFKAVDEDKPFHDIRFEVKLKPSQTNFLRFFAADRYLVVFDIVESYFSVFVLSTRVMISLDEINMVSACNDILISWQDTPSFSASIFFFYIFR